MEETFYTSAIILKRTAWREHDSKVTVYSLEKGKLELVARGTKKILSKLASHLEPITLSDLMVIKGRQLDYVGAAISEESFRIIKSDLAKIFLASEVVNLFNSLVKEQEKDPQLFYLLRDFLLVVNSSNLVVNSSNKVELLCLAFKIKLVAALGYAPDFNSCLACGQKIINENYIFDFTKGGIVCSQCGTREGINVFNLNSSLIKNYQVLFSQGIKEIAELDISRPIIKELERFIGNYILANIK